MRSREAVVVSTLLSVALAGCVVQNLEPHEAEFGPGIGPEHPEGHGLPPKPPGAPDAPALPPVPDLSLPPAPRFLAPVALPQEGWGAEPKIAIAPDGTIFVSAGAGTQGKPNVAEAAAWLWRSRDGGNAWETLRAPDRPLGLHMRPFCSCDSDVIVAADGTVYHSDWWAAPGGVGNFLVERSANAGESWLPSPITTVDAAPVDRQWLLDAGNGRVGLFYAHLGLGVLGTPIQWHSIRAVFSDDGGATWGAPVMVVPPVEGYQPLVSRPLSLGGGAMVAPHGYDPLLSGENFTGPQVRAAVSRDGGASWTSVVVAEVPAGFDNIWPVQGAADAAGNVYIAWAARSVERNETMPIHVAKSADGGLTWSEPVVVRGEGLNFLPWIAARGEGQVAIGWYGGNATGEPTEASGEMPWYAYVAESLDGGRTWGVGHVSEHPVKWGPICVRGFACDGDRELLDYVGIEYAPDGRLVFGFARSIPGDISRVGHVHVAVEAP